jgi:hypothetical protein
MLDEGVGVGRCCSRGETSFTISEDSLMLGSGFPSSKLKVIADDFDNLEPYLPPVSNITSNCNRDGDC